MNVILVITAPAFAFVVPFGYVFGVQWSSPHEKPSLIGFWLLEKYSTLEGFLKLVAFSYLTVGSGSLPPLLQYFVGVGFSPTAQFV